MGQKDSTASTDPPKSRSRRGWVRWLIALCGVVLFWELIVELDLIPFYLLLPKIALMLLAGLGAILFSSVSIWSLRKHGRSQFSMMSILVVTLMVAWSIARVGYVVRYERQQAAVQEKNKNLILSFGPKKLSFGGRYNDGHRDTVARYFFMVFGAFLNQNAVPKELVYIVDVDLNASAIDDQAIPILVSTGTIERLNLSNTKITDAALDKLATLQSLRHLEVSNTAVTNEAIERMKELRPDVEVIK